MKFSGSRKWQLITEESAFRDLEHSWEKLYATNPAHRPFLAWGWVTTWLEHLAGDYQPHIICLRGNDSELQFVLPLIRSTGNGRYRSPRLINVCGYGADCSDHLGALRLSAMDSQTVQMAATGIAETCSGTDRVELGGLESIADFSQNLANELGGQGRSVLRTRSAVCPAVDLPDSWETYLLQLSSNFRSQVRRHSKRIDNDESAKFMSLDSSQAEEFTHELIRLNRSRMGAKGTESSLEDPAFRRFLLAAIPDMARAGLAWMDVVESNGKIVGAALNLIHGTSVYYYMGGFDESSKNLRPGTALFARVIRRSIESGYTQFDFLRGAESYKYRWGAEDVSTHHITVYPRGIFRGQLARNYDKLSIILRGHIRKIRQRSRGQ